MGNYSIFLPSYSVGEDCYKEIAYVTRKFGKKAVVIGGKTAMEKVKPQLLQALEQSEIEILDFIWYGGDSTYENVELLKKNPLLQKADMIFGVGGGRACDTVKTLASKEDIPFFTFPTLASNCAACTAISVIYNQDGTFREYDYLKTPAYHTFINTKIIADSPTKLLWAGIGDALSKECEVLFASRDKPMYHTPEMGIAISRICTKPLLMYGKQALEDCDAKKPSFALEQVALDIIMSTGIVSNFVTHQAQADPNDNFYYNSSIAHCVYYGASMIPVCEKYLHGEIVSFGVLCLLTYDNQIELRDEIMKFNHSIGLPITLKQVGIQKKDLFLIAKKASSVVEWTYIPGTASKEKFIEAMEKTDFAGREFLDKKKLV